MLGGRTHSKSRTRWLSSMAWDVRFWKFELLEVPHYALKKLAKGDSGRDLTAGYVVVNAAGLLVYVARISEHLSKLLEADRVDLMELVKSEHME